MWVQDLDINKENSVIILKDSSVTKKINLCILSTVCFFLITEMMIQWSNVGLDAIVLLKRASQIWGRIYSLYFKEYLCHYSRESRNLSLLDSKMKRMRVLDALFFSCQYEIRDLGLRGLPHNSSLRTKHRPIPGIPFCIFSTPECELIGTVKYFTF